MKYLRHQILPQEETEERCTFLRKKTTVLPSDFIVNVEVILDRFCTRRERHDERSQSFTPYHKSVSQIEEFQN